MKKSRQGKIQNRMNAYREKHPVCEWCWRKHSEHTHHIKAVGMGGAPENSPLHQEPNFIALCWDCHRWAETHPKEAKKEFKELKEKEFKEMKEANEWAQNLGCFACWRGADGKIYCS